MQVLGVIKESIVVYLSYKVLSVISYYIYPYIKGILSLSRYLLVYYLFYPYLLPKSILLGN